MEEPIIPNKFIKCESVERFNEVTANIVAYEDERTNGEYSRTNTTAIYPEPDEEDYPFYFSVQSKWFELFALEEMIDEIPQPEIEGEEDVN